MMAPMLTFILALVAWAVIPFDAGVVLADINVGILYLFAISSLGVYGIIMAGWACNSKYAFLGALRSAAQMVSYEVSIGFVIITVLLCVGSLNLTEIVEAQRASGILELVLRFGRCCRWSSSSSSRRWPRPTARRSTCPRAKSELVAGYFVEYSSMTFALFFLGEYANMILMSAMTIDPVPRRLAAAVRRSRRSPGCPGRIWFAAQDRCSCLFVFLLVRATFPRYRYDQLMRLGWKVFLPFSLLWVVLTARRRCSPGRHGRRAVTED